MAPGSSWRVKGHGLRASGQPTGNSQVPQNQASTLSRFGSEHLIKALLAALLWQVPRSLKRPTEPLPHSPSDHMRPEPQSGSGPTAAPARDFFVTVSSPGTRCETL
jgi:hypothetical protein